MRNLYYRWHYLFVVLILATLFIGTATNSASAYSTACTFNNQCYAGYVQDQFNHGVEATIGTPSRFYGYNSSGSSYMFINSQTYDAGLPRGYIETGWLAQNNNPCGSDISAFYAYRDAAPYDANNNPNAGAVIISCASYYPLGGENHIYAVQYDGVTGYWSHTYDGEVFRSEPGGDIQQNALAPTGYGYGYHVTAFGQTDTTNMQMGGANASVPVLVSNISYKALTTGGFTAMGQPAPGTAPFFFGIPATCPGSGCPYNSSAGNSSGIWYTSVWTQENLPG